MRSRSAFMLLILTTAFIFAASPAVFAEDDTLVVESFQTVTGSLTQIDESHKRVTIRWMNDDVRLKYQDVLMDVPESCVIVKNGDTIALEDLESGDAATVRFDMNGIPLPKASSIVVTE